MLEQLKKKPKLYEAFQWIVSLVIVIIIVSVIRSFLFRTISIKGVSMEPGLLHGDVAFVNLLGYHISNPEAGDVIVCTYQGSDDFLIKRIIGLPGDVIDIQENTQSEEYELQVVVNGERLEEDYIKEPMQQKGNISYPYTVPPDNFFVMGDNRNLSSDSRSTEIGTISRDKIIGKAAAVIFPFEHWKMVK